MGCAGCHATRSWAASSAWRWTRRSSGGGPVVTLRDERIEAAELGFILYSHGFMVRSDSHCQGPAGEGGTSVRVSLHVYNTPDEIDRLLAVLDTL